jgi:hypothetical protein
MHLVEVLAHVILLRGVEEPVHEKERLASIGSPRFR